MPGPRVKQPSIALMGICQKAWSCSWGGSRLLAHMWGSGLAGVSDPPGAPWHFEWRFVIYAVALLRVIPEF